MATEAGETAAFEARIDSLGQDGDGVVRTGSAPLHVPYTLPGEQVLLRPDGRNRASASAILTLSPDRAEPPCTLFGTCGGCVLQHQLPDASLAWKTGLVQAALRRAGFADPVHPVATAQSLPHSRRRMDLALRRMPDGLVIIGLHARASTEIVDLTVCTVLEPDLLTLIDRLRPVLSRLQSLRRSGVLLVNLLDSGPDLLLRTDGKLIARDRQILADFAAEAAIPRISWEPEDAVVNAAQEAEIASLRSPVSHRFHLSDQPVQPPPGAFLQATASGEAAIIGAVLAGLPAKLPRSSRLVELYAGCGTLSFALAERGRVLAVEGNAPAVRALTNAGSARRIEARQRDLNRQPLLARDFEGIAAIVLDPPHAGAGAQMREIADSLVPCVIYVSCNPTALAADTALLHANGYALERLTVIDQFLWSARVESVSVFSRRPKVHRGPLVRPLRRH